VRQILYRGSQDNPAQQAGRPAQANVGAAFETSRQVFADHWFQTRLTTVNKLATIAHSWRYEHSQRRDIFSHNLMQSYRRVITVDHARRLAPQLREVLTRREDAPSAPAGVFRADEPAPARAVRGRENEYEMRLEAPAAMHQTQPPAPPNMEWITSQVIQQIDRRLVAYRERMGRT
jgi:hypothetical protein